MGSLIGAGNGLFAYLEMSLDPKWYFNSVLSLAPAPVIQKISGTRLPCRPGSDDLYDLAYSDMMEKAAGLLAHAPSGSNALRLFSSAVRHRLSDPAVCAKLIAERQVIEGGLAKSRQEAKEVLQLIDNVLSSTEYDEAIDEDLDYFAGLTGEWDDEDGIYASYIDYPRLTEYRRALDEWDADLILQELIKYMDDGTLWRQRETLAETLAALHSRLRLEMLHPLVPTLYTLYVPFRQRARVAKAVEVVLSECASSPKSVFKLSPREFELLVARLFEAQGYEVEVTSQTKDGGKDILCMKYEHGIPFKLAVEVKRYRPDRRVNVGLVRSFVGANAEFLANKLVYVSTSGYTRTAQLYAKTHGVMHLLELKSLPDIAQWASEAKPAMVAGMPEAPGTR